MIHPAEKRATGRYVPLPQPIFAQRILGKAAATSRYGLNAERRKGLTERSQAPWLLNREDSTPLARMTLHISYARRYILWLWLNSSRGA